MHEFSTVAEIETGLQFLIDKFPPLVARLARAPGTKEPRYAHLLSGEEILEQQNVAAVFSSGSAVERPRQDRIAQLEEEISNLREEIESLKQRFENFKKQFD